jgi:putative oxidoreductase
MSQSLDKYQSWASFILRVIIGTIFLLHGLQKFGLLGGGSLNDMFGMMGMPMPGFTASLVATIETVGGLWLILGLGTRIWSILRSIVMVVVIVTVKLPMAPNPIMPAGPPMPGYELDLALLAGLLALILLGSGQATLEKRVLPAAYT